MTKFSMTYPEKIKKISQNDSQSFIRVREISLEKNVNNIITKNDAKYNNQIEKLFFRIKSLSPVYWLRSQRPILHNETYSRVTKTI